MFRDLPRKFPWTESLDWRAMQVRKSDMDHFGQVLIFGGPDAHALFLADERLTPVTAERPWRLYRIAPRIRTCGSHPWPSPSFPGADALRAPTPGFEPSATECSHTHQLHLSSAPKLGDEPRRSNLG